MKYLLIASLLLSGPAFAQKCSLYKENMKRYSELRKKGGSPQMMENWKKAYKRNQDLYRQCTGKK